jgi:hypothetical protein
MINRLTILLILSALTVVGAAMFGCSEKEVPYVVDADELIRYVTEDEYARELFRTSGLINTDPYEFSFDSGVIKDSLITHARIMETFMVPLDADHDHVYVNHGSPIGSVREAMVRVHDRFTLQVSRTYSDTVLYDTTVMSLDRFGFFLKLLSDNRPFVGWVLYGFNGVGSVAPPLGVELVSSSGTAFRGDLGLYPDEPRSHSSYIPRVSYIRLAEMDTVIQGSRLHISTRKASSVAPTCQLVSDYDSDGPFTRAMHRYDNIEFIDSLSFETVTGNPRLYNLVFVQYLVDSIFPARGAFVVPYRW